MEFDEGSNSIWRIMSSISTQNYHLHFIFTDFISLSNFQLCLLLFCLFWSGERDNENWDLFWKYTNMIRWRFENWVEACIKRARKHCLWNQPNIKIPGKSWKKVWKVDKWGFYPFLPEEKVSIMKKICWFYENVKMFLSHYSTHCVAAKSSK